jgi:TPR repeat protein
METKGRDEQTIVKGLSHFDRSASELCPAAIPFFVKLSAVRGDAKAQYGHGARLCHDRGVPVNHVEAARHFKRSADQGESGGQ